MTPAEQKIIRADLWMIASLISGLSEQELQAYEKMLNEGLKTSVEDTALIRISRLVRRSKNELSWIESKLAESRPQNKNI